MRYCLPLLGLLLVFSCRKTLTYQVLQGETMGTYYRITYRSADHLRQPLEQLLHQVNQDVNHYDPGSTLSAFNRADTSLDLDAYARVQGRELGALHFWPNWELARQVYQLSEGAYDPTVMPLVNYWGFGYEGDPLEQPADSSIIDSLRAYVGMDRITREGSRLLKDRGMQLDFSSCAKGYAVDVLAQYLLSAGVDHFLVDIGGEARAQGVNADGEIWRLGVNVPNETAGLEEMVRAFPLQDRAIATSGNYRNVYTVQGQHYSHTIYPHTGYPERSKLLSATIFAPSCLEADTYATACMVLGVEKGRALIEQLPDVEAFFVQSTAAESYEYITTDGVPPAIDQSLTRK